MKTMTISYSIRKLATAILNQTLPSARSMCHQENDLLQKYE